MRLHYKVRLVNAITEIPVYSENHMKIINTLREQMQSCWMLGCTRKLQIALKVGTWYFREG
jgi:hypothetical protein